MLLGSRSTSSAQDAHPPYLGVWPISVEISMSQVAQLFEIKAHHACSQSWPSVSQKWPGQEQEIL